MFKEATAKDSSAKSGNGIGVTMARPRLNQRLFIVGKGQSFYATVSHVGEAYFTVVPSGWSCGIKFRVRDWKHVEGEYVAYEAKP